MLLTIRYQLCYCLLFCFYSVVVNGQSKIEGTVRDTSSKYIEYANVIVSFVENDDIVSFDITDEKGGFSVSIGSLSLDSLKITVRYLGFQDKVILLSEIDTTQVINIFLSVGNVALETVEISEKLNYTRTEDTVSYNLNYYRDSTETNIGELLDKIPGVDVDDIGNVTVYSKPIKNITIDDVNITRNKYQVISSSLRADIIKKAEIIFNYVENDLLRSFLRTSEDISINLVTEETFRSSTTGTLDIGFGIREYDVQASVFSLGKGIKLIGSSDLNNVGRGARKMIPLNNDLVRESRKLDFHFHESWASNYTSNQRDLTRLNHLFTSRIDTAIPIKKVGLNIYMNLEGGLENHKYRNLSEFYNFDTGLYRTEQGQKDSKIRDVQGSFLAVKRIKNNQELNLVLNFGRLQSGIDNTINEANWIVDNIRKESTAALQYLNKFSDNKISITKFKFRHSSPVLDFHIDTLPFINTPDALTNQVGQNVNPIVSSIELQETLLIKSDKTLFNISFDFLNNDYSFVDKEGEDRTRSFKYSIRTRSTTKLSSKTELIGVLEFGIMSVKEEIIKKGRRQSDFQYLNVSTKLNHILSRNTKLQFSYSTDFGIDRLFYFNRPFWHRPFYLVDNRVGFRPERMHSMGYNIGYSKAYPALHLLLGGEYNLIHRDYILTQDITTPFIISRTIEFQYKIEQFVNFLRFDIFLEPLNMAFKSNTQFIIGNRPLILNNRLNNSHAKTLNSKVSLRSAFIFPVNLEVGVDYQKFWVTNESSNSKTDFITQSQNYYGELTFKFKTFSIKSKNYLYITQNYASNNSDANYFSDLSCRFKVKQKSFELIASNIFNIKNIRYIDTGISGEIVSKENVLPRQILLKFMYQF